jgi:nitroimidazol reductase NimA-like FMN-containing flavoprotein (pyridoxamine 5'-phosphate oxidase superfamily)
VFGWDECVAVAATQHIGRLGVTRDALPMIMPVAFAMLDAAPVFRVGSGVVHRAAAQGAVTCFEVDAASADWASAWSVMMIG